MFKGVSTFPLISIVPPTMPALSFMYFFQYTLLLYFPLVLYFSSPPHASVFPVFVYVNLAAVLTLWFG